MKASGPYGLWQENQASYGSEQPVALVARTQEEYERLYAIVVPYNEDEPTLPPGVLRPGKMMVAIFLGAKFQDVKAEIVNPKGWSDKDGFHVGAVEILPEPVVEEGYSVPSINMVTPAAGCIVDKVDSDVTVWLTMREGDFDLETPPMRIKAVAPPKHVYDLYPVEWQKMVGHIPS